MKLSDSSQNLHPAICYNCNLLGSSVAKTQVLENFCSRSKGYGLYLSWAAATWCSTSALFDRAPENGRKGSVSRYLCMQGNSGHSTDAAAGHDSMQIRHRCRTRMGLRTRQRLLILTR